MGEELQSWKSVFRLGELLELAAARKQAQSHNRLYGNLTFSQSRVCIALIRLLEKQPEGVTLKQLSAELEVTPGAASELVEELVKKALFPEPEVKRTGARSASGSWTMSWRCIEPLPKKSKARTAKCSTSSPRRS